MVLGAGFGGLELTTRLSEEFGDDVDVVLIDQGDGLRLRVLEARRHVRAGARRRGASTPTRDLVKPGVTLRAGHDPSIDPAAKRVETDAGPFDADILVVALGADLHPDATPGLLEGGHEFYTVAGAFALRDVLADFAGGRVIVGRHLHAVQVPAGAQRDGPADARLPDRARAARAVRDLPGDAAARARSRRRPRRRRRCSTRFAERGIDWHPERLVRGARPRRARWPCSATAPRCRTTCSSASRCTGRPTVVEASGMTRRRLDPRRPADARDVVPRRLRRRRRDQRRHAEGRRLRRGPGRRSSPTRSSRRIRGGPTRRRLRRPRDVLPRVRRRPGGQGRRHLRQRPGPVRHLDGPVGRRCAADKAEFGSSRIQSWFDRPWLSALR